MSFARAKSSHVSNPDGGACRSYPSAAAQKSTSRLTSFASNVICSVGPTRSPYRAPSWCGRPRRRTTAYHRRRPSDEEGDRDARSDGHVHRLGGWVRVGPRDPPHAAVDRDDRRVHPDGDQRREDPADDGARSPGVGTERRFARPDEPALAARGDDRDRVDLDHRLGGDEGDDPHRPARGGGARQVARANLAHRDEVIERRDVGVHLHDVGERRAVGGEQRLQVLVYLLRLAAHVADADDRSGRVRGDLSGDVQPHRVARLDLHDVRVRAERRRDAVRVRTLDVHACDASHSAASFAWYVRIRSAPARRIEVRSSRTVLRSSSHPFCAAAFTIAYSPLTLYAAVGNAVSSFTRRTMSRYGTAGLTITTSAPSSISARTSRIASSPFAGSIW